MPEELPVTEALPARAILSRMIVARAAEGDHDVVVLVVLAGSAGWRE